MYFKKESSLSVLTVNDEWIDILYNINMWDFCLFVVVVPVLEVGCYSYPGKGFVDIKKEPSIFEPGL